MDWPRYETITARARRAAWGSYLLGIGVGGLLGELGREGARGAELAGLVGALFLGRLALRRFRLSPSKDPRS